MKPIGCQASQLQIESLWGKADAARKAVDLQRALDIYRALLEALVEAGRRA
ncbi:MAG: hypothetical protein ACI8Y4_005597 [Candidatus Poriferisodalaceae bacterium]|jgi:hypothetical protein